MCREEFFNDGNEEGEDYEEEEGQYDEDEEEEEEEYDVDAEETTEIANGYKEDASKKEGKTKNAPAAPVEWSYRTVAFILESSLSQLATSPKAAINKNDVVRRACTALLAIAAPPPPVGDPLKRVSQSVTD